MEEFHSWGQTMAIQDIVRRRLADVQWKKFEHSNQARFDNQAGWDYDWNKAGLK